MRESQSYILWFTYCYFLVDGHAKWKWIDFEAVANSYTIVARSIYQILYMLSAYFHKWLNKINKGYIL